MQRAAIDARRLSVRNCTVMLLTSTFTSSHTAACAEFCLAAFCLFGWQSRGNGQAVELRGAESGLFERCQAQSDSCERLRAAERAAARAGIGSSHKPQQIVARVDEPRRLAMGAAPRWRCSLARVLVGVGFALVAFVATHGWLQSLQDVEREVEHLFHPHQMGRDHFVRPPSDGANTLCDEGGCRRTAARAPRRGADRRHRRREPAPGRAKTAGASTTDGGQATQVAARPQPRPNAEPPTRASGARQGRRRAAREASRETRHHYPREDDGALRAREQGRSIWASGRGPARLATGYTGSDFVEEDHDPHAPEDLQKHFEETAVLWDR